MKKCRVSFISMILAAVMVLGSFAPSFAAVEATDTTSEKIVTTEANVNNTVSTNAVKRLKISGLDMTFDTAVAGNTLASNYTVNGVKTTGYRSKMTVIWDFVSGKVDGYIILRKDLGGYRFREIARVAANVNSFTDENTTEKNTIYSYTIIAYKSTSKGMKLSPKANWAGCVTSNSKSNNVYSTTVNNYARLAAINLGSSIQASLTLPKNAYSTKIRWFTSNSSIVSVDKNGIIKGKKLGSAVIYARAHTGRVTCIPVTVFKGGTAQSMIDVMRAWMGYSYYNKKNRGIVDIYNSMYPLPCGYKMKYWDAWCDCSISAAAILTGNADRVGRECSVGRHVKIFKQKGIWIEGNKTVPKPGDLIVFNWFPRLKNNASHIGIVEKVEGNTITTIEGNKGIGKVDRRTIQVGWKYIKGYARPAYLTNSSSN